MNLLPEPVANAVWDLLMEYGASEHQRIEFLAATTGRGITEFRFQGEFGFGGKFWVSAGRWYVSCYSEDLTAARQTRLNEANARLAVLKAGLTR